MSLVNVIIGHFYHLYVYMSHLTVSEGLFCYRFVYMSHAAATAGHFCHSPVYMSHFPYSLGYFSTFILYMSRLVLSAGFYVEQKCFAKGNPYICWFQYPKSREIHNSMYYRLRRLLFFGIIRNLFSCCIHMKVFLHNQL